MNEVTSSNSDQSITPLFQISAAQIRDIPTYALLDENDIVINIIKASHDFIQMMPNSGSYVLSHDPENPMKSKGSIGTVYDREKGAFIHPRPFPSWTLDENFIWTPPVPFPVDEGDYEWDEASLSWKPI